MATFDRVKKVVVDQLDVNEDEVTPTASHVVAEAQSMPVRKAVPGTDLATPAVPLTIGTSAPTWADAPNPAATQVVEVVHATSNSSNADGTSWGAPSSDCC